MAILSFVLISAMVNVESPDKIAYVDIGAEEVAQLPIRSQYVTILDVRSRAEYESGHIAGAISIHLSELEGRINELDRDRAIIVYCKSGVRSEDASNVLVKYGFKNAYNMLGGINAWVDAGFPVVSNLDCRALHCTKSALSDAALPSPAPITNNDVCDYGPVVDVDSLGNVHVAYDAWDGNDWEVYYLNNIGGSWNPPVQVTNNSYRDEPVRAIAVDQSGYVHITYNVMNPNSSACSAYYVNNVDGSWNIPEKVTVPDQEGPYYIPGDMALDSLGHAHFYYMASPPASLKGWYRYTDGRGYWSSPKVFENPDTTVAGSPVIFVDASDIVHLASLGQAGGFMQIFYSKGLSTPKAIIPPCPSGWLDLAVDSSGKVHIVYTLSSDPNYWHKICTCLEIAYVTNAIGGWSSPIYLTHVGAVTNHLLANRMPIIDVDASDNLHVTWEAKNTLRRWEVYYATTSSGSWKTKLQVADLDVQDHEEGCNAYIAVGSAPVIVFNGHYCTNGDGDDEIYAFTPADANVSSTQTIPAGDPETITFGTTGVAMDFSSGPGGSVQVDRWESSPPAGFQFHTLPHFWDITTDMAEGTFLTTVTFDYTDAEVTAAGIDENKMVIAYYNGGWVPMTTNRDTTANKLWTTTNHFTIFAIGQDGCLTDAECFCDGWYCSGNVRQKRDYSCSEGACQFTVTDSENCYFEGLPFCCGNEVCRYYGYCDVDTGACRARKQVVEDCNDHDGWYCQSETVREYRDYYCDEGSCVYQVTETEDCTLDCPEGEECVCDGGNFYCRAVPEFPLGFATEIALALVIIYGLWKNRRPAKIRRKHK